MANSEIKANQGRWVNRVNLAFQEPLVDKAIEASQGKICPVQKVSNSVD